MIVAGIDPSLTGTGLAILQDGRPVALHKIGYPGHDGASDLDRNRRVVALVREVAKYVRAFKPDLVCIESPAYSKLFGSACDRHGLWHGLLSEFDDPRNRYAGITPTCRAQFATGNGHASKQHVIDVVNAWWPHLNLKPKQDNHADAMVLAAMGAAWAGDELPFELREYQRNNLEAVAWPVMAA